jgi:uncharacterized protein YtpQ (UPF0354 family)
MRVRAFLALALIALVVLSASACNSGGGSADSTGQTQQSTGQTQQAQTLSVRDFKNKVAAEVITGSDYQADPGFGPLVDVSDPNGLNTLQIVVTDAYNDYRAHPERQQEIVQKLVDDSVSQLDEGNSKRGFAEVRDQLMPLLKRSSALEGVDPAPALSPFHELDVAYGVQRDHSFALVTKDDLRRWNRSVGDIDKIAISNLEDQTNKRQKLLCEPSGGQKLCGWASGDGYDAARMLVPGLRRQIVEQLGGPAVYAVPLESVFVALTRNYADVIRGKVLQEFTTGKNPLSPDLFEERNGELFVLPR